MSSSDLITDRLVLRPWSTGEVTAVLDGVRQDHWADDFPSDGDRVIAGVIAETPDALGEFGQRLIIERSTGLAVGAIGLFWPPGDGRVEFGYGVVASRRGRGYATEAALAIVAFALAAPGVDEVVATVELSNPASARVLENAGLRRVSTGADTAEYSTA
ncbi:GNAT family N-acetyltransferase [Spirillospora sp. CA-128828]|uniref:GNAT family N-acetyltransferase n=1 Tax=Spirillospora sp. CA-128828 TaxID=3240033 RepID=UPI003D909737